MKHLFLSLSILFLCTGLNAQAQAPKEKSDPEAKKVLDKVRRSYESYKSMDAGFDLRIEIPGEPATTQKGKISQDGEKFRLEMDQQTIVTDGTTTWVYLKANKEIQISDYDPQDLENGFMSPKQLLSRYQKGDFLYTISDKITENGKVLTQIEFKPVDRNSEYIKIRITIDEKANRLVRMKAFARDGSRYTFSFTSFVPNKTFSSTHFKINTKDYPGVHVEDLRM